MIGQVFKIKRIYYPVYLYPKHTTIFALFQLILFINLLICNFVFLSLISSQSDIELTRNQFHFTNDRRMQNNLRTNALQSCEEWNAFFAQIEIDVLPVDLQQLTRRKTIGWSLTKNLIL